MIVISLSILTLPELSSVKEKVFFKSIISLGALLSGRTIITLHSLPLFQASILGWCSLYVAFGKLKSRLDHDGTGSGWEKVQIKQMLWLKMVERLKMTLGIMTLNCTLSYTPCLFSAWWNITFCLNERFSYCCCCPLAVFSMDFLPEIILEFYLGFGPWVKPSVAELEWFI